MRVTLVHNFYRGSIPSGEDLNIVEHQDLVGDDVKVTVVSTSNGYVVEHPVRGRLSAAAAGLDLRRPARRWLERVLASRPHCVQIENLVPLIPESFVGELLDGGIPTVRRWGNYRFRCPNGNNFRDGHPCRDCSGALGTAPAVLHRCYGGSRVASTAVAARGDALRPDSALHHLPVSEFVAAQLAAEGVPAGQMTVIPNAVAGPTLPTPDRSPRGSGQVVYLGSLAEKKGLGTLLGAWAAVARHEPRARLRVIGDGPMRQAIEAAAAADRSIGYVPTVAYEEARRHVAEADVVVVPSEWDEPFGRVVIEAFAEGTPVVVSDRGALPELLGEGCGSTFPAGDEAALSIALGEVLARDDAQRRAQRDAVLQRYATCYSPEAVRTRWHAVYGAVA
jgi:glycosyltransferase involved in cell wall biosynthesis